ncbi:MAG: DUF364 domain-containing protein [Clostridiales bacterium]|nr:DUF364 domain-containing protein [Clostridiales bacterium]
MWNLYDKIINAIPNNFFIDFVNVGETWTVVSAGAYCGVAVTVNEQNQPLTNFDYLCGRSLQETATLCKSWDFQEASVGTAAVNAYLNSKEHLQTIKHMSTDNAFDDYRELSAGKKVAVIGHFTQLERFLTDSEVYVLERNPQEGDYPDSACEYILPEMDYVFITGSAFINKTLPRLLALSKHPIVLGPSTPMSPALLEYGAKELSGLSLGIVTKKEAATIGHGNVRLKNFGERIKITV